MSPGGPMVVALRGTSLVSFQQLSTSLRRRGVHTVGVTNQREPLARLRDAVAFDTVRLVDGFSPAALRPALRELASSGSPVVDVLAAEDDLPALVAAADGILPAALMDDLRRRLCCADKLAMSTRLRAAGIAVPAVLDLAKLTARDDDDPLDAGPVVIKARIGLGGTKVAVVHTPAAARAARQSLGGPEQTYAEQWQPGPVLRYAAAHGPHGVTHEATYRMLRVDPTSTGPASAVTTTHDPELVAVGRAVLDVIGGYGLVNVETMRTADEGTAVIDVNVRPWHSVVALQLAGVDFTAGYLRALGLEVGARSTRPETATPNRTIPIFPSAATDLLPTSRARALRSFAAMAPDGARLLGAPFVAAEGAALARQAMPVPASFSQLTGFGHRLVR